MTPEQNDELKNLVNTMVCAITDDPTDVEIKNSVGEHTVIYEVYVPKPQRGKVIGKKGRNAAAMRAILSSAASKFEQRAILEIVEF